MRCVYLSQKKKEEKYTQSTSLYFFIHTIFGVFLIPQFSFGPKEEIRKKKEKEIWRRRRGRKRNGKFVDDSEKKTPKIKKKNEEK